MSAKDKLNSAREKIALAKKELLDEVLNNDSLSKFEKLEVITNEELFGIADWIQTGMFRDWEIECNALEKKAVESDPNNSEGSYVCTITDDYFTISDFYEDRRETVYFMNALENLLEEPEDLEIVVVSNRGKYGSKIYKKPAEIIDRVCDYCFENKIIGCVVDW